MTKYCFTLFEYQLVDLSDLVDPDSLSHVKRILNDNNSFVNKEGKYTSDTYYYTLYGNVVQFHQYVGVLQVYNVIFEILPKIDYESDLITYSAYNKLESRTEQYQNKVIQWREVLIQMLLNCQKMKISYSFETELSRQTGNLFSFLIMHFLDLCEIVVRDGLIRKYIPKDNNRRYLKGKLLFTKHIQLNNLHKERFFTRFSEYSYDIDFNQILFSALDLLISSRYSHSIRSRASSLKLHFQGVHLIQSIDVFNNLKYDRKSDKYRSAIKWAELLLKNYRPSLKVGQENLISIMFDMNKLWEEYLYSILKKEKRVSEIHFNSEKEFWSPNSLDIKAKRVKPDIILKVDNNTIVLDAKWKIPKDQRPSSTDLMQLFSYAMITGAENSYLVFPIKPDEGDQSIDKKDGGFKLDRRKYSNVNVQGGYLRVSVLNEEGKALNQNLGNNIIRKLIEN